MDNKYLTVSAITRYLKAKFDIDENLKNVFIKGEISNFKAHTSGHLYFSLKDEGSKINAIMFKTNSSKLTFTPADGTKVLITGRISVYEAAGNYQIYVDDMIEDGIGNLYIAFEKLKKELEKEGLFNKNHKLQIPKFPKRVGVITASTGAAVRDIITTIKRRFPICEIILFPTLVQGENAKEDIVKNIKKAEDYDLDVLIIGRGGGSIEDLWAFNEEIVARAIYDSKIPTISAVGHEVDFTISDFVSDLRAPTPTAAAELAVPNLMDLQNHINQLNIRLNESINKKVNYQIVALVILGGQTVLSFAGVVFGIVSAYYYYKIYYILWILVIDIAVEVMSTYDENKELKVIFITYLTMWCLIIYTAISGLEIKLAQKAPTLIENFKAQSLVGIYYDTNIAMTANINVSCIVDENRVKLAEAMGEVEDLTLKNMLVGGMNTNCKAWIYVISGIKSGGESINDLQKAVVETSVKDWLKEDDKKYFVLFTADEYKDTTDYKVIFNNEAGVILEKRWPIGDVC